MTHFSGVRQTGTAPFRARARLIRLLGEELISDEVMAVVELVKNSYDADAGHVLVELSNITDPARALIRIRDNGSGMALDTLLYSWMEPATPRKQAHAGRKLRTPRGRIQLGEKGVGRFAADKLGADLELITRLADHPDEIMLRVGWQRFDHDRYLDEVENTWITRDPVDFAGAASGTLLLIRGLRTTWNEDMVRRLQNGLLRLVSPSTTGADFAIEIACPEFPWVSGLVVNQIIDQAPYRLAGTVDAGGILTFGDTGQQLDLRPHAPDRFLTPTGTLRDPVCGPFALSLNVWDLEPYNSKGVGIDKALRQTIKASAGISIYRDHFRIWPYGEKDDDWLELNQRRVNNPTLRISNNQVIGFVEITHSGNPDLRDRTSREGLLDTPALFDLKALTLGALAELEAVRFSQRRPSIRRNDGTDAEADELLRQLQSLRATGTDGRTPGMREQLKEIERLYRQRLEQERVRYQQVARLAGVGMAAELLTDAFSHEILATTTILHTLQGEVSTSGNARLRGLVADLAARIEQLNEQLDLMGPLYRPLAEDNTSPINLWGALYDVLAILARPLQDAGIQVALSGTRDLAVRMNRGHLIQVLMILIENAQQALRAASASAPQLAIQIVDDPEFHGLRINDNGPGIPVHLQPLIFEPYFSTRHAGRGLGLHVARDILAGYNATLTLVSDVATLPGACFAIRFDGRRTGQRAV